MKDGWNKKPFEECIEKVTYTQKIQRKDFLDEGACPIISQEENFINGYWNNEADLFKVTTPVIVFGDHTKVLKYIDFDFVLGADGVKVLKARDFLVPKFFYYQLQSADLDSLGYARHYKLLKELVIVYPPQPEQARIVGILDEACDGIATAKANAEKSLQNARSIFISYLKNVFTNPGEDWEEKSFDRVCVLQRGFDLPTHSRNAGSFPLVSSNGITDWIDTWKVKAPGVVTGRSGTIGNIHYIETDFWPLNTALYIKDFQGNDPRFVYYFLKEFDLGKYSSGAGVPTLNRNNVHGIRVKFPKSILEQQRIVSKMDALAGETNKLESNYQKKLAALDDLKKSMLHQAFNGAL